MARLAHDYNNHPGPSHASSASKPAPFDEDIASVLDDDILDSSPPSAMQPTATHDHRHSSFPHSGPMYSPRTGRIVAFPPFAATADSTQFYLEQGSQPYPSHNVSHAQPFANAAWQSHSTSESLTPTPVYDGYTTYDSKDHTLAYNQDSVRPLESQMYGGLPVEPGALFQSNTAMSASPQSAQDWISNSSNDHLDLQSVPKHPALTSPTFNSNPPLLRRDGIRKKNARFEIPAERTLRTIDQLITQTTDEQEIKELKQQKRLLRNRQAA